MVSLYRKSGNVEFNLPKDWKMVQTIFKEEVKVKRSVQDLAKESLENPVGSRRLEELLKPGDRVAVVVDDLTRPTPIHEILPVLLDKIHRCGISAERIDIIVGVGTHRPLTKDEIRVRCGEGIAKTYQIQNHDARAPDLIKVGDLPGAGPVFINATVAKADVKITMGSILPHPHNGFGGGPKNIMPGICDFDTIRKHHLKNVIDPRSILGNVFKNPFYKECCEIAKLAKVDFTLACHYDSLGQIFDVTAGDLFTVHQVGIEKTKEALGVSVPERADVTFVSSYPYDEGPQIVKPILPAAMVTKPGGTIILLAEISAPLPGFFLDSFSKIRGCSEKGAEFHIRKRLECVEPIVEGPMDFNMALLLIFFASIKYRVVLVADPILQEAVQQMGFEYAPDLSSAIEEEKKRRKQATVNLIPAGGYVFPIVSEEFRLIGG